MIASAQIANTESFVFIAILVKFCLKTEKTKGSVKNSRLLFKKTANFKGKLLQSYK